ncbi:MAG: NAD-dependent deacylase [Pseudomonadota bacterium]|nr:NAD-dependent deacylase [Pseudomonadota bacterium]
MDTVPSRVVVLSGAGLSAASGVPTFRGAGGLWEGHAVEDVATPEAWRRDPELVRRFYDARRSALTGVVPNAGHRALVRLQAAWGTERVLLVTQNIDGLLGVAGAQEVLEMHGALRKLRCSASEGHPWVDIVGDQDRTARCACGAPLRPAVVWFGEVPLYMPRITAALAACQLFLSVGTSGLVYPAAGFVRLARQVGARCVEVNPAPVGGPFHEVIAEGGETALPRLVAALLA